MTTEPITDTDGEGWSPIFVTAQDGLRLHVRDYRAGAATGLSVVCLPGLTRTGADFHELARTLAGDAAEPRRVIALDYRAAAARITTASRPIIRFPSRLRTSFRC